jgi:hypothetical protein
MAGFTGSNPNQGGATEVITGSSSDGRHESRLVDIFLIDDDTL